MSRCPRCTRDVDAHPAGECLDRWVHKAFLGKSLPASETPPHYSGNIGPDDDTIEELLAADKWPDGATLSKRSGSTSWCVSTGDVVLAEGDVNGLAVCRAAVKCPPGGKVKLIVTYMRSPYSR